MSRKYTFISPLGLLALAACGGGSGSGTSPVVGINFVGNAVKGPLDNALVFIDLNNNFIWDEGIDSAQVSTDADGAFNLSNIVIPNGVTPNIVVVGTSSTLDTSSGLLVGETFKLTAPGDTSNSTGVAVTPVTTLLTSGDLTQDEVAAALGLEGIDNLLTYNPYNDTDSERALKAEQTAHQVMNVISTLQAAGVSAGLSAEASLDNSLKAFKTVIQAADANNPVNLTDATDGNLVGLDALADSFIALVEVDGNADAVKVANLKTVTADVLNGVSIVNERVAAAELVDGKLPTDLSEFVSTTNKLVADVATAVDIGNTDSFYIKDASDALNAAKNKAATIINLEAPDNLVSAVKFGENGNITIEENIASGSVIAMVSSDDTGSLKYKVTSADATVAKFFKIVEDQEGVKLVVADGVVIDYEKYKSLEVILSVQDSYGKEFRQDFKFTVSNVDEDPEISEETLIVSQGAEVNKKLTITDPEGSDVTVKLDTDSDLFALNDNVLSAKREITQADVDAGDITLSFALTDEASGKTVFDTITVSITNVNDAPTFSTASIIGGTEGKAYSQKVLVNDADGDPISLELVDPPAWLTISSDGILSGTVPSDDTKILSAETVTIKATDGQGGETLKDYILEYTNVNDAPEFALSEIKAYVLETADAIGFDAAQDSDKLTGSIVFNDLDPGDTLDTLTLSLVGAGSARADGKFVLAGDYGEMVFDPSNFTYVYSPDADKIEPLHAETVTDDFTFKVFDEDGASDSLRLSVNITGADDNPRLAAADEQDFITLGNDQSGTVVGSINVLDGSKYAGFVLAPSSVSNDNEKFERTSSGELKLKDAETTDYSSQKQYIVEVFAQDYNSDGSPIEGTKSEKSAVFTIKVSATDPAPKVVSVTTDYADQPLAIGDVLNFTVKLSEAAKADGSTTMTLSNGSRVTLSVGDSDSQFLTGQYEVQEGDTDATTSSPLEVNSISAGTVTDLSDQALSEQTVFDELGGVIVDANAPSAKLLGTDDDPHTYDPSTGKLTLKGSNLGTIVNGTSRDVVNIVDWGKLSWNIDGLGSTTLSFSSSLVKSALVNAGGTSITVQLSESGMAELHSLNDFGGVEASGGTPDALNVANGFLRDLAGNSSSSTSTAVSEIFITDQSPPLLASIEVNGSFTATSAVGRKAGDTFIIGDTLTFTATVSEASDLASLDNMQVSLTLSNNKQLKLLRADNADGSVKTFSAAYVISEDDDDVTLLSLKNYSLVNIKDIAGNVANNDLALADVEVNFSGVAQEGKIKIDATAPTAKLLGSDDNPHTYDAANGVLNLQGEGLKTIMLAADNFEVKSIVDWSKLTWNVDGEGGTTHIFSANDIQSAKVNADGTVLIVTLTAVGQKNLHDLDGFGGTVATGGVTDALEVAAGFMRDKAGNLSTQTSTAVSEVALDDTTALVLSGISFDGDTAERIGEGAIIGFKAVFTDPLAATGTELADDAELVLTLNNGVNVTLGKSKVTGEELYLVGEYKVAAQDDTLDASGEVALDILSVDASAALDVAGNKVDVTGALAKVTLSTDVIVDTIAPQLDQVIFDSNDGELVFVFQELLDPTSISENLAIMQSMSEVVSVTSSGEKNTTITASLSEGLTFSVGDTLELDDPFSFADLAGNVEEIYLIEIGGVLA